MNKILIEKMTLFTLLIVLFAITTGGLFTNAGYYLKLEWESQIACDTLWTNDIDTCGAASDTTESKWFTVEHYATALLLTSMADSSTGTDSVDYDVFLQVATDTTSATVFWSAKLIDLTTEADLATALTITPSKWARVVMITGGDQGAVVIRREVMVMKRQ